MMKPFIKFKPRRPRKTDADKYRDAHPYEACNLQTYGTGLFPRFATEAEAIAYCGERGGVRKREGSRFWFSEMPQM